MGTILSEFKDLLGFGKKLEPLSFDGVLVKPESSINGILFDATVVESHTVETEFPEHPVEFGASINDHRIVKPLKISMTGVVSNFVLINPGDKQQQEQDSTSQSRSQFSWETLKNLQVSGELFDVVTILTLYKNMQITSLTASQDKDSSTSLKFTAQMREVIVVETSSVALPDSVFKSGKTKEQASSDKKLGTKKLKEPNKPFLEAATSWAKELAEGE